LLAKASPRTTPDKGRKARLSSPHWPLDVLRRGSCAPFVLPLLLPRPALSSSPLSRLGPCFGSNKLRRGSQLLRRRLQRTRDQPSPVSGLRQPLRHSILPGHSDRQRICTDGLIPATTDATHWRRFRPPLPSRIKRPVPAGAVASSRSALASDPATWPLSPVSRANLALREAFTPSCLERAFSTT
jgi:hypothetical protein